MIRPPATLFVRFALVGVMALALGLAACGRKGGLDAPPSAAAAPPPGGNLNPPPPAPYDTTSDGRPQAPDVPKKRIPALDWLLN